MLLRKSTHFDRLFDDGMLNIISLQKKTIIIQINTNAFPYSLKK